MCGNRTLIKFDPDIPANLAQKYFLSLIVVWCTPHTHMIA
jgi:hypothetical protein